MEQFNVTGMSCAACSARVEKAVKSVPGVTGCSVSLLTNSMGVEGTAEDAAIIRAVEQAGYGASPKKAAAASTSAHPAVISAFFRHKRGGFTSRRSIWLWAQRGQKEASSGRSAPQFLHCLLILFSP